MGRDPAEGALVRRTEIVREESTSVGEQGEGERVSGPVRMEATSMLSVQRLERRPGSRAPKMSDRVAVGLDIHLGWAGVAQVLGRVVS